MYDLRADFEAEAEATEGFLPDLRFKSSFSIAHAADDKIVSIRSLPGRSRERETMNRSENAQAAYLNFIEAFESLILATVSAESFPNASYAPFVRDEAKNFYIYVSGLAIHTRNLLAVPRASILLIEDESNCDRIFARTRLSFECTATVVERESQNWNEIVDRFASRFGETIEPMRSLADFQVFQLTPHQGRFVRGFGAIYQIEGDDLDLLQPLSPRNLGNG
jgi:heme iron utilization protein